MNDDYLKRDPEELLLDPEVQAYVLEGKNGKQWAAWLDQHPEEAPSIERARTELLALQGHFRSAAATAAEEDAADAVWQNIDARISQPKRSVRRPQRRWRRALAFAAAAAVVLGALLVNLIGGPERYRAGAGQQLAVALPDGSSVVLAPKSQLEVVTFDEKRTLRLKGEAFFEVAKGSPFTVETPSGKVAVLGTSFEVVAHPDALRVACKTGRVQVTRQADTVLLTRGLRVASAARGLGSAQPVAPTEVALWRTGTLVFEEQTLAEISSSLGRYYNREVQISPAVAQRTLTLRLPAQDFASAVEQLTFVLQTPVDTSAGGLRIR